MNLFVANLVGKLWCPLGDCARQCTKSYHVTIDLKLTVLSPSAFFTILRRPISFISFGRKVAKGENWSPIHPE